MTAWRTYSDPPESDPSLSRSERKARARARRDEIGFADAGALYAGFGALCTLAIALFWRAHLLPREVPAKAALVPASVAGAQAAAAAAVKRRVRSRWNRGIGVTFLPTDSFRTVAAVFM